MYKRVLFWLLLLAVSPRTIGQTHPGPPAYRNFPLVLSLQFHSLSYPFRDLRSPFRHLGFGIGTEIALGSGPGWAQQFQLVWYRNREAGNGLLLYTQSVWRPTLAGDVFTELKAGFGFTWQFRAGPAWRYGEGLWHRDGHAGKWMFTVPAGISVGSNPYSRATYAAPFASYQVLVSTNYARGIPLMTNSLFQVGSRIHFSEKK